MHYTQDMADAEKSSPKMSSLGIKRKDMYPKLAAATEASPKDYDNEIVFPAVSVRGKQAEMMGAADLEAGECVKQTVVWKVKSRTLEDTDGKKEYRMELELVKGSDLESCDEPDESKSDEEKEGSDDSDEGEMSPGLAFILGGKGSAAAG